MPIDQEPCRSIHFGLELAEAPRGGLAATFMEPHGPLGIPTRSELCKPVVLNSGYLGMAFRKCCAKEPEGSPANKDLQK